MLYALSLMGMVTWFGMTPSTQTCSQVVRVATWNVFDLPEFAFPVQSGERMSRLPAAVAQMEKDLGPLDAIAFNEFYVAAHRDCVLAALAPQGFTHATKVLSDPLWSSFCYSGIIIVSRWPIEEQRQMLFQRACSGLDCLTSKGAVYAKIVKKSHHRATPIHLVATHLYLGKLPDRQGIRLRQAEQLKSFVQSLQLPSAEPQLLAGDLNATGQDADALFSHLDATPPARTGELDLTFATANHAMAGDPRQSPERRCAAIARAEAQGRGPTGTWIDYVAAQNPGPRPVYATMTAWPAQAEPYAMIYKGGACSAEALSDHYPVVGTFVFAD